MTTDNPALKLAHRLRHFDQPIAELAREVLLEQDRLKLKVWHLERALAQVPKFQGMTELA